MTENLFLFDTNGWMFINEQNKVEKILGSLKDIEGLFCFDSSGREYNIEKEGKKIFLYLKETSSSLVLREALKKFIKKFNEEKNLELPLEKLIEEATRCYKLVNWSDSLSTSSMNS